MNFTKQSKNANFAYATAAENSYHAMLIAQKKNASKSNKNVSFTKKLWFHKYLVKKNFSYTNSKQKKALVTQILCKKKLWLYKF